MMQDVEAAQFLCKVFGPFLTITSVWKLVYSPFIKNLFLDIEKSRGAFYSWGAVDLLVGLVILMMYNQVVPFSDLSFISILGYFLVFFGAGTLFTPLLIKKIFFSSSWFDHVMGIFPLVWGLILIAVGFFNN